MKMKGKIIIGIIIAVILIVLGVGLYYSTNYSHADDAATIYLNGTDTVNVSEIDKGLYLDGPGNDSAMIFYPGAQIEYTAYLPLLIKLSENGADCFLVDMPLNLAVLDKNSADQIINKYNYSYWFIGGHSLGGSIAASYALEHDDKIDGLILLASYPSEDLKGTNLSVLSVYGTNDERLNLVTYKENLAYMPEKFTEFVIDGGNHGQFGSYGLQEGDGAAAITPEQQWNITVNTILIFINSVKNTYI